MPFSTLIFALMLLASSPESTTAVISERISRSAVLLLNGPVHRVFPLFGPVREKEWAEGWNPVIVFPQATEVAEHMVVQTTAQDSQEGTYTWAITQYRPEEHLIEYTVSTLHRIWFIRVHCKAEGQNTKATVTYTYTSLTDQGKTTNRTSIEKMFAHDLKDWEEAINVYLETGKLKQSKN